MPKFILLHADLFAGEWIDKAVGLLDDDILLGQDSGDYHFLPKGKKIVEQLHKIDQDYIIMLFHPDSGKVKRIQEKLKASCRKLNLPCFQMTSLPPDIKLEGTEGEETRVALTQALNIPKSEIIQSVVFDKDVTKAGREGFTVFDISQKSFHFSEALEILAPIALTDVGLPEQQPLFESEKAIPPHLGSIVSGLQSGIFNNPQQQDVLYNVRSLKDKIKPAEYDEMVALKEKLTKEINSFWPYPNKEFKRIKVDFLARVLALYDNAIDEKLTLRACVERAKTDHPDLYKIAIVEGWLSNRTRDLLNKILESNEPDQVKQVDRTATIINRNENKR